MRVISGKSRGRTLRAPTGGGTRPTSDRVREAIFDILGTLVDLEGARVADLFAGSGAMGIEALSRGAGSVVFVDRSPAALRAVRSNLEAAGLEGASVAMVRADVVSWLSGRPGGRSVSADHFDLALCDPPYDFASWEPLLRKLDAGVAVLESNRLVEVPEVWDVIRQKRYGGTLVTVVSAAGNKGSGGSRGDAGGRSRRVSGPRTTVESSRKGKP